MKSDVETLNTSRSEPKSRAGILDLIEWIGNKLPHPATLFLLGTLVVMVLSAIAAGGNWEVKQRLPRPAFEEVIGPDGELERRPILDARGKQQVNWEYVYITRRQPVMTPVLDQAGEMVVDRQTGQPLLQILTNEEGEPVYEEVRTDQIATERPRSLLSPNGMFWAISHMVENFMKFPPLGVVLVGMLGIGIAERTKLIGALLKAFMLVVPGRLLTPAMVFIGILSSMAMDAGYVVLPPLAAALYKAVGRSPLAGLAAVFAGVSAGFNANLFITGLDPMLAKFANIGAQVIDPKYQVNPACNWLFMAVSTVVITLAGWATTSWFVERRLARKSPEDGGPALPTDHDLAEQRLKPAEIRGLKIAVAALAITQSIIIAMIVVPGAPMHGSGTLFARWVEAIVPIIFVSFLVPALAYGIALKQIRTDKDAAGLIIDSIAAMAPIIVLSFFAAQFIECFKYSGLDRMLAMAGGQLLGQAQMNPALLIITFIGVTMGFNLFVGSMSAKYAMFAPIFIPMFMMVGISPELTQAAYRIGDSVTNIITPLNAYLVIVLVYMQKNVPRGGMGTLISTMLPYTLVFAVVWTVLLLIWMSLGIPLGFDGALWYDMGALQR
jgi:aminobenzoyl-glutamate transport protein